LAVHITCKLFVISSLQILYRIYSRSPSTVRKIGPVPCLCYSVMRPSFHDDLHVQASEQASQRASKQASE